MKTRLYAKLALLMSLALLAFNVPEEQETSPSQVRPVEPAAPVGPAAPASLQSNYSCAYSHNNDAREWYDRVSSCCNIDVRCDQWKESIPPARSTVLLRFADSPTHFCGGVLVNNTSLDRKAYIIAAWHCGGDNWRSLAPDIRFQWNYESPYCRVRQGSATGCAGEGRTDQFKYGATVKGEWPEADIVLLELNDLPSLAFDTYYAGWDASAISPDRTIFVHFPEWSEKRISFNEDRPEFASVSLGAAQGLVQTFMVQDWENGCFEGSSGSPLFNQNNRLVGVATKAPIDWNVPPCSDPLGGSKRGPAYFGRFQVAWQNGLTYWLDPCGTRNLKMDGIDHISPFADVPGTHPYYYYIDSLYRMGFVAGCSTNPRNYCPDATMNRAESAVFVERGIHGASYTPPIPTVQIFADVPLDSWAAKWVTSLWYDKYTAGCGTNPRIYCPWQPHIRAEAAVFFLHMLHGPTYQPPQPTKQMFPDVPLDRWYAKWVHAAYNTKVGPWGQYSLMEACPEDKDRQDKGYFCPDDPLKRSEAAKIMVKAKGLPLPCEPGTSSNTPIDNETSFAAGAVAAQTLLSVPALKYSTYLGGSNDDVGNSVAVDSAGNIYIAGYTDSSDFPDVGPLKGAGDAFVAKLKADRSGLAYVTVLGGSDFDEAMDIAVDSTGNAYVLGNTDSLDLTTTNPFQATLEGERDVFVAKLNADGALVYSTYLGGSGTDEGHDLAIDSSGNVYVTGRTYSTDFPLTATRLQGSLAGAYDAFVAKLDTSGALAYSTFLGGSDSDSAYGLAVDSVGNVYITGETGSADFPTSANPVQANLSGSDDAFVTKLSIDTNLLVYSTYLGASLGDQSHSIAVDAADNAYVIGHTASTDFPVKSPLQDAHGGGIYDVFVAKLNTDGTALVYSTYLGGTGGEEGLDISVDREGIATITGRTGSVNLPTAGSLSTTTSGNQDLFVARIAISGSQLLYSRYLGGNAGEQGNAIAIDRMGDTFVTGYTLSPNLPTENPLQAALGGERDAFVAKIGGLRTYLPLIAK